MHKRQRCLTLTGLCLLAAGLLAQTPYLTHNTLNNRLKTLAEKHAAILSIESIGRSTENRNILVATLGRKPDRPALAVIANIEANRLAGSAVSLAAIERMAAAYGKDKAVTRLLDDQTIYIIPRLNVDGAEHYFSKIKIDRQGNLDPADDDRDGLLDEDGGEDLNGDGLITQMRRAEAGGSWMIDPAHPRLLKKADALKHETGRFALYTEGVDNDGDSRYNEDGPGGTHLNHNFPHAYPYHAVDAGTHMTSAPETRALLDFFMAHRNIAMVLTFSAHDNLMQLPKAARKKPTAGYNRAVVTEMDKTDLEYLKVLADAFKNDCPHLKKRTPSKKPKAAGALHQWAYFQYGALALTTPAWAPPAICDSSQALKGDAAWLKWFEQSGTAGFVNWTPFHHPQLGDVEIGGFAPYAKTVPAALDSALLDGHCQFISTLAHQLPKIQIARFSAEKKATGIYHVKAIVQNTGYLPTGLAHAVYAGAVMPTRITLSGEAMTPLSGDAMQRIEAIAGSGATKTVSWTVQARSGTPLTLTVWTEKAGSAQQSLTLK